MERGRLVVVMCILIGALVAGVLVAVSQGQGGGANSSRAPLMVGIAIAVGVVLVLVLVKKSRRKSGGAVEKPGPAAVALGLEYAEKADQDAVAHLGALPRIPRSGHVRHLMIGPFDHEMLTAFEHHYVVNTGQSTFPVYNTVFAVGAPEWPTTTIRPRRGFAVLAYKLGFGRGMMLEHEPFNSGWTVRTDHQDFALVLLSPEVQQLIARFARTTWSIDSRRLAIIRSGKMTAERLHESIDLLRLFFDTIPRELYNW